jgi:hypothetical protein
MLPIAEPIFIKVHILVIAELLVIINAINFPGQTIIYSQIMITWVVMIVGSAGIFVMDSLQTQVKHQGMNLFIMGI